MHSSRGARAAILLGTLTVAAMLAACSTSSDGTPSTGATGTGSAPGKAALAALLLTKTDLPAGWTAGKASSSSSDDGAAQERFAKCVGIRNTHPDKVAEADSPDYSNQGASISSSASSYSSPADVTADASGFRDHTMATTCMNAMLRTEMTGQLPAGTSLDNIDLKVVPGTGGGPSNVIASITGTITVTASGQQLPVYLDSTYIAGKQIEAEVDFESFGARVDTALQAKLVKAVAERVANA